MRWVGPACSSSCPGIGWCEVGGACLLYLSSKLLVHWTIELAYHKWVCEDQLSGYVRTTTSGYVYYVYTFISIIHIVCSHFCFCLVETNEREAEELQV